MYLRIATSSEASDLFSLNVQKAISLSLSRSGSYPTVNITVCPWQIVCCKKKTNTKTVPTNPYLHWGDKLLRLISKEVLHPLNPLNSQSFYKHNRGKQKLSTLTTFRSFFTSVNPLAELSKVIFQQHTPRN